MEVILYSWTSGQVGHRLSLVNYSNLTSVQYHSEEPASRQKLKTDVLAENLPIRDFVLV